jgi:hypothetical protein
MLELFSQLLMYVCFIRIIPDSSSNPISAVSESTSTADVNGGFSFVGFIHFLSPATPGTQESTVDFFFKTNWAYSGTRTRLKDFLR